MDKVKKDQRPRNLSFSRRPLSLLVSHEKTKRMMSPQAFLTHVLSQYCNSAAALAEIEKQ
jgi:hypothetical protein